MSSSLRFVWIPAFFFVLLWNSGFIAAEFVLPQVGPLTLLFWRYWALTGLLALYLAWRKRLLWPGWQTAGTAMIVGVLAHGIWLGCVLYSLRMEVPAGIVALIVALQPLVTGALSGIVVGESTDLRKWIGLIVGFAGVAIVVGGRAAFVGEGSVLGHLLPFGSVVAITIASLAQRRLALRKEIAPLPIDVGLFFQGLGTALVVTAPAIVFEGLETQVDPAFLAAMAWLVVGVSMASYGLMWLLVARIDATRVASLFYLGPPVTMVMAWIAFGDQIGGLDLIGLAVVAVGVGLAQPVKR